MTDLTQERLKELVHYCPDLGLFWWKERPVRTREDRIFNTKYAGQIAGNRSSHGYGRIGVYGTRYYVHRLAWFYMTGEWPAEDVDHANGWKLDNAFTNLRSASRSQNMANRPANSNNTTGFKGVFKRKNGTFSAQIGINKSKEPLGTFDTPEEASEAYTKRAHELYGEFARSA